MPPFFPISDSFIPLYFLQCLVSAIILFDLLYCMFTMFLQLEYKFHKATDILFAFMFCLLMHPELLSVLYIHGTWLVNFCWINKIPKS